MINSTRHFNRLANNSEQVELDEISHRKPSYSDPQCSDLHPQMREPYLTLKTPSKFAADVIVLFFRENKTIFHVNHLLGRHITWNANSYLL